MAKGFEIYREQVDLPAIPEFNIPAPPWMVRGSFVLDQVFNKQFAADIDLFIPAVGQINVPEVVAQLRSQNPDRPLPLDITRMPNFLYWPPTAYTYNTDLVVLTGQELVVPKGYKSTPEYVRVEPTAELDINTLLRGIRTVVRYDLPPTPDTVEQWREMLRMMKSKESRQQIGQTVAKLTSVGPNKILRPKIEQLIRELSI